MSRKKKPTKLHRLHGNPGKRKLDLNNEAQPDTAVPKMPKFLCKEGQKEWRRIVPQLEALGLVSEIDKAALAGYCQCFGRLHQVEALISKGGLESKEGQALMRISNKLMQQMRLYLTEFGLSPSSRAKAITAGPRKEENAYQKWKNRNKKPVPMESS